MKEEACTQNRALDVGYDETLRQLLTLLKLQDDGL